MPRDQRLYMTFPIDFHRHPKFKNLTVDAKWTFVEMNGEARCAENDGRFEYDEAVFLWNPDVLEELAHSHPTRPLIVRDGDFYVIRDYADHQFTKADREELHAKRAEAGRKGGLAKSQASASQVVSRPKQTQAESESESEDFYSPSKSQSLNTRARVSTDAIPISAMTKKLAGQMGVTNLRAVVDAVAAHCQVRITADQAYQLALWVLDKRKTPPDSGQRYVLGAIERSSAEVQQHIYEAMEVA